MVGGPAEALRLQISEVRDLAAMANRSLEAVEHRMANDFKGVAARFDEEHKQTRRSFVALQIREILAEIAATIERDAAELYDRLHAGEIYDEAAWDSWESIHHHWRGQVVLWIQSARWFARDVDGRVLTTPDAKFGRKWSIKDAQFPASEESPASEKVRRFKQFRIIQTQWEEIREEVDQGIKNVAYSGLSEEEVRREPPQ